MISEGFVPEEPEVESITPTYDMLKGITKAKLSDRKEPYGLCPKPTPKKAILHAPLTKEVVGSGCHATFTCNVTEDGTKRVATQSPCRDVGCERLDSVSTVLAKRTGDTPHLDGHSIPIPTHTSGDTVTSDADAEAVWPSGVALSIDEIDDDKTEPSHLSCVTRRAGMYRPMGRMISCLRFILKEMKAFRRIFVLSVLNSR